MFQNVCRRVISILITLALFSAAPSFAIARTPKNNPPPTYNEGKDEGQKKDKDKDKDKDDDKDKLSKQEREYQKIKQFSEELYSKDEDFRAEVGEAYRQKQREHIEYAYDINTRDATDERIMRTGDKLKVYDALYDNPLVQDYVNRVGQSLVPKTSTALYAFKVTLNPIPEACSLSTGTIYVSSGLLSIVDNEAQLAYILAHEIGHIERKHWREDALVAHGMDRYNEKQKKRRAMFSAIAMVATGGLLKATGGQFWEGAAAALIVAPTLLKFIVRDAAVSWDKLQEDEADDLGLKYMFDRNYDPREVPKFYASLKRISQSDYRVGLGFMAESSRVAERDEKILQSVGAMGGQLSGRSLYIGAVSLSGRSIGKQFDPSRNAEERGAKAEKSIEGRLSADVQAKLDAGEIIGTTAEFSAVMAELKRDNGVRAYYYDMFQMSRDNLQESLMIRSNDPYAHLYYGKVLKLTARTPAEKSRALFEFVRAIELDRRRVLPEAHLHHALAMMEDKNPSQTAEIVTSLKDYVSLYQREHAGQLPPNMDVIYDYMQEAGEMNWSAAPAINVSTKDIDPINTSQGSPQRPSANGSRQQESNSQAEPPAQRRRRP